MMVVMAKVVMLMLAMMVAMMDMMLAWRAAPFLSGILVLQMGMLPRSQNAGHCLTRPLPGLEAFKKTVKMLPDPQQENLNVCKGSASISDSG